MDEIDLTSVTCKDCRPVFYSWSDALKASPGKLTLKWVALCQKHSQQDALLKAAKTMLTTLDDVTPHEFMRGAITPAYEALKAAITKGEA